METITLDQLIPFLSERGRVELDLAITKLQLAQARQVIEQLQTAPEIPTA